MRRSRLVWLAPFRVSFLPDLHSSRRRLYSGGDIGQPVHAASSLRKRQIVFDRVLLKSPGELRRIVTHELFHFVWVRLGNPARRQWEALLAKEFQAGGRGELGWSAEWRKRALSAADRRTRSRVWREYTCESFCDTAAWLLTGARAHDEATLAARYAKRRAEWFVRLFESRPVVI